MNTYLKYSLIGLISLVILGLIYAYAVRVKGRYILLQKQEPGCMNFTQLEVYTAPFGENVAKNAKVVMSTLFSDLYKGENLTNGLRNTFAHTLCGEKEPQNMIVDLGQEFSIYKINLVNRTDCCSSRASGVIVSVLNNEQNPVYSANQLSDRNGKFIDDYEHNGFGEYVFFPPMKKWFGY